jgi:hypothetical protein
MANSNTPNGFIPHERCLRSRTYIAAGTIYPGDCLKFDSGGGVVVCAAGDATIGAALSYAVSGNNVQVADSPSQLFRVKASSTEIDAQTDINLNYSLVATSGSTLYKASRMSLDSSTQATTAALTFKLLAIDPRPDNVIGSYVDCVVSVNNHQLKGGTGTLGV